MRRPWSQAKLSTLFARVEVVAKDSPRAPLEVHVGRARVVVPTNFDPAQLRAVVDALGAST